MIQSLQKKLSAMETEKQRAKMGKPLEPLPQSVRILQYSCYNYLAINPCHVVCHFLRQGSKRLPTPTPFL